MAKNLIANLSGSFLTTVVNLIAVPVYIKSLGTESYGLIGFYTTLTIVFSIFDMGLSATMIREMAWLSAKPDSVGMMRNLARTFEIIFWLLAIIIGLIVIIFSPLISSHWIINTSLSKDVVANSVLLMGISLIFHLPIALYIGGLTGLQKLVTLNIILGCTELAKLLMVILLFYYLTPSIELFFVIQICVIAVSAIVLAIAYWQFLPKNKVKAAFDITQLKRVRKFSAGMAGLSVVGVILTQMDKVVLIRILPLKQYGYYILAGTITSFLYKIITPVFQTYYPKLVQLVSGGQSMLRTAYHNYCQLMIAIILPVGITICIFSKEIIFIWTRNMSLAEASSPIASVLIIGTILHGLMFIPYALQLSNSITKLSFYINVWSIVLLLPLLLILVKFYGTIGAAFVWVILNTGYFFVTIPLMHRYLLKNEMWKWYISDVLKPAVISISAAVVLKYFFVISITEKFYAGIFWIAIFTAVLYIVSFISTSYTRNFLLNKIRYFISHEGTY